MSERLIIDTDTAGDDVTSLLIALLHPNSQLDAITICNGNVDFDQQVENALYPTQDRVAQLMGNPSADPIIMLKNTPTRPIESEIWLPSSSRNCSR